MLTWSTDDVPAADRFAFWREVRAKNLFGVSVELEQVKRAEFRGEFSILPVGNAALVEMHASAYRVERSEGDIARAPSDSWCIYQQLDGGCWFDVGRGDEFIVPAGALATSYADRPYKTAPTSDRGFHLRVVKIPFALCEPLIAPGGDMAPRLLGGEGGIESLLSSYFSAFVAQAPHLDGAAADAAVRTLAHLALVARGLTSPADEPGRDAVVAGRLQAAQQIIERHLDRRDLSPASAAAMLGISVRQLHLLFEPTGTSFARYLLAQRLERARLLLASHPDRSVFDIALACGIESSTVFYRGFRGAYGMTPTDYRQSLSAPT